MKAVRGKFAPFLSISGVPLLGITVLIACLWHPHVSAPPGAGAGDRTGDIIMLQDPDPRLDRGLTVCLRQQAKEVARCRRQAQPAALAEAVAGYNLVARECTPAVFRATGMPSFLEP